MSNFPITKEEKRNILKERPHLSVPGFLSFFLPITSHGYYLPEPRMAESAVGNLSLFLLSRSTKESEIAHQETYNSREMNKNQDPGRYKLYEKEKAEVPAMGAT